MNIKYNLAAEVSSVPTSRGLNIEEVDHIAYCAMDVLFAIINFVIGYKVIYSQIRVLNSGVKQMLVCFYVLMVLQVLVSAAMLILMFRFKHDHTA